MKKKKIIRISVDLTEAEYALLERIANASENNHSRVMKDALFTLREYCDVTSKGGSLSYSEGERTITSSIIKYNGLKLPK